MSKHLHIVMHDVPWPANFGGVTDLYFKLKSLQQAGIKVHLHCFVKNRPPQPYLEKYCESVEYYPRKNVSAFSMQLPYIVASRKNAKLVANLEKDDHPVLLEGIHCSYPLFACKLQHRKVFLRLHNVEHKYYSQLARHEANLLRRLYFLNEARLLKKYESAIAQKASVWAVSEADAQYYRKNFSADAHFLPVFLPWQDVNGKTGKGDYCLYHGNLSINENEKAAEWLITKVFKEIKIPLIIAGMAPSAKLVALAKTNPGVELLANPDENIMQQLVENAQVNVLPSFNDTGVKLKLLNALFNGRHCVVNRAAVDGSGVAELCRISDTTGEFQQEVQSLFAQPFTERAMQHRGAALKNLYNNEENTRRISAWIW